MSARTKIERPAALKPDEELIAAALLFVARHTDGRGCSVRLDPDNCGSSERLIKAAERYRVSRAAGRSRKRG